MDWVQGSHRTSNTWSCPNPSPALAGQFSPDEKPRPKAGKPSDQPRLDFEALVEAFRHRNPRAICRVYLGLANEGVTLAQLQTKEGRLHFTFCDPDGNRFSICP